MTVKERGPWGAGETEGGDQAFVASDDFTHDVRLYVNGDFGTKADRLEYAKEIAKRLNAYSTKKKSRRAPYG